MADGHIVHFADADLQVESFGEETLLAAALRAGVNVPYGCSNGNCGECVASLVKGDVKPVRPHDFALSEAQKAEGRFLMCSTAPRSDVTVKAELNRRPKEYALCATVRKVSHEGPRAPAVVSVRPRRSLRLRFVAGQYVRLSFADYAPIECSVASCPCDETRLEFHIFEEPENDLRRWLFSQARPGQRLELFGPLGEFMCGGDARRPVLFIAHTLGFAPVKSMLEHITAREGGPPVVLCRVADARHPHYMQNLCRSWDDALEQLTLLQVGDDDDLSTALAAGVKLPHNKAEFDVYISAPEEFHAPWREAVVASKAPVSGNFMYEAARL